MKFYFSIMYSLLYLETNVIMVRFGFQDKFQLAD